MPLPFLKDYVLKYIWANPDQDSQYILTPKRISGARGVMRELVINMRCQMMPNQTSVFHIYQIGQIHPKLLKLIIPDAEWMVPRWINIQYAANTIQSLHVGVYTGSGVQIPKYMAWYTWTREKNLVVAIEERPNVHTSYGEQIYIRLYNNAYYALGEVPSSNDWVISRGSEATTTDAIINLQYEYSAHLALPGSTLPFVNGILSETNAFLYASLGSQLDYVYDRSMTKIIEYPLNTLLTFNSILDGSRKYLLHYVGVNEDFIEYLDDIDFYLIYRDVATERGLYLHKNEVDTFRMVSHRDYSIAVNAVEYHRDQLMNYLGLTTIDNDKLLIRAYIRKGGYRHSLVYESHKIHELYKMTDADILQAMIGTAGGPSVWRVEELENSPYPKVMGARDWTLETSVVEWALGYNSISRIIGNTPQETYDDSGVQKALLPIGLQTAATVYEYDSNGVLLEWHYNTNTSYYHATNPNTRYIEAISGIGSHAPDVRFGDNHIPIPTGKYRVYRCHRTDIGYDNLWEDITDSGYYEVVAGYLEWLTVDLNQFLMVRTDETFLSHDYIIRPVNGVLYFTLAELENRDGLGDVQWVLGVPPGEMDLYLNGHPLIRGVDYYITFPEVVIINKKFLTADPNNTDQVIHFRGTGFCTKDLELNPVEEVGFIEHGVLSNNNRFDLRDDRVLRMVMDGGLYPRSKLIFSETHLGVSTLDPINGLPYSIREIIVPLRDFTDQETYSFREISKEIDVEISNYLTEKIPQPPRAAVSAIPERYPVYSPFISSIIRGIKEVDIPDSLIAQATTDAKIIDLCKPYERWLPYDPFNPTTPFDENYILVHPHNNDVVVTLSVLQYSFVVAVLRLYGYSKIQLSPFVTIA